MSEKVNPVTDVARQEPVIVGMVARGLAVAVAFGVHLEPAQIAAVIALVEVVSNLIVRAHVTPSWDVIFWHPDPDEAALPVADDKGDA